MTDLKAPTLGRFCHACQAIPVHGYCRLAGCPTAPTDLKAALTDDHDALCDDCPPVGYPTDKTRCGPCPRQSPGPALRGEGGKGETKALQAEARQALDTFSGGSDASLVARQAETIAKLTTERDMMLAMSKTWQRFLNPDPGGQFDTLALLAENAAQAWQIKEISASHAALTEANGRMRAGLAKAVGAMDHASKFVTSHERIKHPEGTDLWLEARAEARALLAQAIGEGKT